MHNSLFKVYSVENGHTGLNYFAWLFTFWPGLARYISAIYVGDIYGIEYISNIFEFENVGYIHYFQNWIFSIFFQHYFIT